MEMQFEQQRQQCSVKVIAHLSLFSSSGYAASLVGSIASCTGLAVIAAALQLLMRLLQSATGCWNFTRRSLMLPAGHQMVPAAASMQPCCCFSKPMMRKQPHQPNYIPVWPASLWQYAFLNFYRQASNKHQTLLRVCYNTYPEVRKAAS
jgi:hypothetical protein